MINLKDLTISKLYLGEREVAKVYLSESLVYENAAPEPVIEGAVKFKSTGVSTIGLASLSTNQTLEYTTDGETWETMTTNTYINIRDKRSVWIRGVLSGNNTANDYTQFSITGNVKASGNINYLWNYSNPTTALRNYCGQRLFYNCAGLTDVSMLELPATTLADSRP